MTNENEKKDPANVVDLSTFRRKKEADDEFGRGREPLYASHLTGRVTGSPHLKRPDAPDFGDRLQRIRASLDKINRLMSELKKLSTSEAPQQAAAASSGSKTTLV